MNEIEWLAVEHSDWWDIIEAHGPRIIAMTFQVGHVADERDEEGRLVWTPDPELTEHHACLLAAAPKLYRACQIGFDFITMGVGQLKEKYGPDFKMCDAAATMEEALGLVEEQDGILHLA